jgi:hypothetical protein
MQQDKERIIVERDILRSEYTTCSSPAKSAQLFAALQALSWAVDPTSVAPPTLTVLAGKCHPFSGSLAS